MNIEQYTKGIKNVPNAVKRRSYLNFVLGLIARSIKYVEDFTIRGVSSVVLLEGGSGERKDELVDFFILRTAI